MKKQKLNYCCKVKITKKTLFYVITRQQQGGEWGQVPAQRYRAGASSAAAAGLETLVAQRSRKWQIHPQSDLSAYVVYKTISKIYQPSVHLCDLHPSMS